MQQWDPTEYAYMQRAAETRTINAQRAKDGLPPIALGIAAPEDGVETLAYAGETPWHGKGVRVDEAMTSDQAITLAGLDWEVRCGDLWGGPSEEQRQLVSNRASIYRVSDSKVLGVATQRYAPIQNREMFTFLDSLCADRVLRYHTAGSLHGGKNVWLLAELEEGMQVAGEQYRRYIMCTSGHDNQSPLTVVHTDVRVICKNTHKLALKGEGLSVKIKHTTNYKSRFNLAKDVMKVTTERERKYVAWLEQLAETKVGGDVREKVRETMLCAADDAKTVRRQEALSAWNEILGEEDKLHEGTAYALLQTITGFADHAIKLRVPRNSEDAGMEKMISFTRGPGNAFRVKGIEALGAFTNVPVPAIA